MTAVGPTNNITEFSTSSSSKPSQPSPRHLIDFVQEIFKRYERLSPKEPLMTAALLNRMAQEEIGPSLSEWIILRKEKLFVLKNTPDHRAEKLKAHFIVTADFLRSLVKVKKNKTERILLFQQILDLLVEEFFTLATYQESALSKDLQQDILNQLGRAFSDKKEEKTKEISNVAEQRAISEKFLEEEFFIKGLFQKFLFLEKRSFSSLFNNLEERKNTIKNQNISDKQKASDLIDHFRLQKIILQATTEGIEYIQGFQVVLLDEYALSKRFLDKRAFSQEKIRIMEEIEKNFKTVEDSLKNQEDKTIGCLEHLVEVLKIRLNLLRQFLSEADYDSQSQIISSRYPSLREIQTTFERAKEPLKSKPVKTLEDYSKLVGILNREKRLLQETLPQESYNQELTRIKREFPSKEEVARCFEEGKKEKEKMFHSNINPISRTSKETGLIFLGSSPDANQKFLKYLLQFLKESMALSNQYMSLLEELETGFSEKEKPEIFQDIKETFKKARDILSNLNLSPENYYTALLQVLDFEIRAYENFHHTKLLSKEQFVKKLEEIFKNPTAIHQSLPPIHCSPSFTDLKNKHVTKGKSNEDRVEFIKGVYRCQRDWLFKYLTPENYHQAFLLSVREEKNYLLKLLDSDSFQQELDRLNALISDQTEAQNFRLQEEQIAQQGVQDLLKMQEIFRIQKEEDQGFPQVKQTCNKMTLQYRSIDKKFNMPSLSKDSTEEEIQNYIEILFEGENYLRDLEQERRKITHIAISLNPFKYERLFGFSISQETFSTSTEVIKQFTSSDLLPEQAIAKKQNPSAIHLFSAIVQLHSLKGRIEGLDISQLQNKITILRCHITSLLKSVYDLEQSDGKSLIEQAYDLLQKGKRLPIKERTFLNTVNREIGDDEAL